MRLCLPLQGSDPKEVESSGSLIFPGLLSLLWEGAGTCIPICRTETSPAQTFSVLHKI